MFLPCSYNKTKSTLYDSRAVSSFFNNCLLLSAFVRVDCSVDQSLVFFLDRPLVQPEEVVHANVVPVVVAALARLGALIGVTAGLKK